MTNLPLSEKLAQLLKSKRYYNIDTEKSTLDCKLSCPYGRCNPTDTDVIVHGSEESVRIHIVEPILRTQNNDTCVNKEYLCDYFCEISRHGGTQDTEFMTRSFDNLLEKLEICDLHREPPLIKKCCS